MAVFELRFRIKKTRQTQFQGLDPPLQTQKNLEHEKRGKQLDIEKRL